jgi:hypothetical protein
MAAHDEPRSPEWKEKRRQWETQLEFGNGQEE